MTIPIVALDVSTLDEAKGLMRELAGVIRYYKVGLQLFMAEGSGAVRAVEKAGAQVFLDLKLLDIPQTVERAVREAGRMGANAVSIHLWGGAQMVHAACAQGNRPLVWGVSVLTSLKDADLKVLGGRTAHDMVPEVAAMGAAQGMDGVVCSGEEVARVRAVAPTLGIITPGIRAQADARGDQARVVTAAQARDAGATYVVVGRPITAAAERLVAELGGESAASR